MRRITIISGGQTGADRAALDFAIDHDMLHGGWCPRGRLAEDGPIAPRYNLRETPARRYAQRTEWNVRDSDATILFTWGRQIAGGTALALRCAQRLQKPCLHLSRETLLASARPDSAATEEVSVAQAAAKLLLAFLQDHDAWQINVAGPRGSQEPAIAQFVRDVLRCAFGPASNG